MTFFVNALPSRDNRRGPDAVSEFERILNEAETGEFRHTLFTTGTKRQDPWVMAQHAMARSAKISPMIAVNPLMQHPVSVAKKLLTMADLYPNGLAVNLISGSFFREHVALNDDVSPPERSERLLDFSLALRALLSTDGPVFHDGKYYPLKGVEIYPWKKVKVSFFLSGPTFPELSQLPEFHFVKSLRPVAETRALPERSGFLAGICARSDRDQAMRAIDELFYPDKTGERLHELSLANDMSPWNAFIREELKRPTNEHYHLGPLRSLWSPAPFIVGSYEDVVAVLKSYQDLGASFFFLDYHESDLPHVRKVLEKFRRL